MLNVIIIILLLAVDIAIVMAAVWVLLRASLAIAIISTLLWIAGLPLGGIAIIAIIFTIGKYIYAHWSVRR